MNSSYSSSILSRGSGGAGEALRDAEGDPSGGEALREPLRDCSREPPPNADHPFVEARRDRRPKTCLRKKNLASRAALRLCARRMFSSTLEIGR